MATTIDNLKATVAKKGGFAPANRFNIMFKPPGGLGSFFQTDPEGLVGALAAGGNPLNAFNDPRDITILCQQVVIPGRTLTTFDHQDYTHGTKFPYGYIDGDVVCQFLLTNDYYIRKMFDAWQSAIVDPDKYKIGYKKDYAVDVVIQQLDQNDIPIYGVKLLNAYPTLTSDIVLDNAADNTVQRMTVTFAYDKFEAEGPISSTASAIRAAVGL